MAKSNLNYWFFVWGVGVVSIKTYSSWFASKNFVNEFANEWMNEWMRVECDLTSYNFYGKYLSNDSVVYAWFFVVMRYASRRGCGGYVAVRSRSESLMCDGLAHMIDCAHVNRNHVHTALRFVGAISFLSCLCNRPHNPRSSRTH